MFELLIGTQNMGKLREFAEIFRGLPIRMRMPGDLGLDRIDVSETGQTFMENAMIKASWYARTSKSYALADDSGLCVDALDGRPGVFSARYAGIGATDADRRQKLLSELTGVPFEQRTAYFECAIAISPPSGTDMITASARVDGHITLAESEGKYGFGYDAIFIPENYDVTLAELPPSIKNMLSHRGLAAQAILPRLQSLAQSKA